MKLHLFPVSLLLLLIHASPAPAVESKFDQTQRFIFHSILEGLYEDGVATEDVDRILMRREGEEYFHFIYACPVCMASVWAFEAYRNRPEALHSVKSGDSTFGWGLGKKLKGDLHGDEVGPRLTAINTLIGRWIQRRMDTVRLSEDECTELLEKLQDKRERGMGMLNTFRRQTEKSEGPGVAYYAPAYVGQGEWECAACNASIGKPMHFGGGDAAEPDRKPAAPKSSGQATKKAD